MKEFDELKLARVVDAAGGIDGRVKMQKIVYLLSVMGYDLPFDDFTIRQQGPFSRAVACAADILKGGGILEETENPIGSDVQGEPFLQYSYRVREGIAPLIREHFDVIAPPGRPPIQDVASELNKRDRAALEVAATRLFLEREDKLSGEGLEKELRRIKGHLAGRFDDANRFIEDMKSKSWL